MNKTFDIIKEKYENNDVQQNLKHLEFKYGNEFNIKYNDIILPVKFLKETSEINPKKSVYVMYYDDKDRKTDLRPFKIIFSDINFGNKPENITYIANIHKTEKISGSTMIEIVLCINKVLKVKKTFIHDGTSIDCREFKHDLSFIKLLEKEKTFYMKSGFEFDVSARDNFDGFDNKEDLNKYISELIKKCRKVKIKDVEIYYNKLLDFVVKIIKDADYKELKIYHGSNSYSNIINEWKISNTEDYLRRILFDVIWILEILKTDEIYLYKLLIKMFNDKENCQNYNFIRYIVAEQHFTRIIYKNEEMKEDFNKDFILLMKLRHSSIYSYTFY